MRNSKPPIQVFEYTNLSIGTKGFNRSHWEALGWYNEKQKTKFFSLTPNGVNFVQYVGVIQVGDITIEILPKIGKEAVDSEKNKWQKVLIDMLLECRLMQVHATDKANLRLKPNSILEAYLLLFVYECERLVREGLIKKYRSVSKNCSALKGKLIFSQQIQQNLVRAERFYTTHTVFDRENIFNQILIKALRIIPIISSSPLLKDRVTNLIISFPELEDVSVSAETFANLKFDRKTERYREAISIAAMILLNYRPDISSGQNHLLAILFDMNDLWEEYIFRQIYRHKPKDWVVQRQNSKNFWKLNEKNWSKTIRPDIVISKQKLKENFIIDTKWKIPDDNIPSDSDLKQMFAYNEYWTSKNAVLLYPRAEFTEKPVYKSGVFKISESNCGVMKISVLDQSNSCLDFSLGERLNKYIMDEELI